jgi:alkylation response protein AidB-like acyl-CoA dehydrogenase
MVQMLYFIGAGTARTVTLMEPTVKLAVGVAEAAAPHAQRHDAEGSFVSEGVQAARDLGYLTAAVPVELGGRGARTATIAAGQEIIGAACGSTALATAMHQHVVLSAAWRWRRGDTVVEPLLRKVAGGLVVVSTGGNDWTCPTTVATPTEGGWLVSGRKTFASLAPVGDVAATFAVIGEPRPGAPVIAFGCPLIAPGVRIDETWDAVGMRGTGSHDIVLDDVFVAEGQVTGRRTWGELDRPLLLAAVHAFPVVSAAYLGVAAGLVDAAMTGKRSDDPRDHHLAGLLDAELRTARWAVYGALADLGDDPEPTLENYLTVQQAKRVVTLAGHEIARTAAELAGGRHYARRGPIDRMTRDLGGARYHPDSPEATLLMAGKARTAALDLDAGGNGQTPVLTGAGAAR